MTNRERTYELLGRARPDIGMSAKDVAAELGISHVMAAQCLLKLFRDGRARAAYAVGNLFFWVRIN